MMNRSMMQQQIENPLMKRKMFQDGGLVIPESDTTMSSPLTGMAGSPEDLIAQTEAEAQLTGQAVGAEMGQKIDAAENYEQIINAIRGDEKPINERKQELAMLVGEEDAMATPDSVLALVQPIVVLELQSQMEGMGDMGEMQEPVMMNAGGDPLIEFLNQSKENVEFGSSIPTEDERQLAFLMNLLQNENLLDSDRQNINEQVQEILSRNKDTSGMTPQPSKFQILEKTDVLGVSPRNG